MVLHLLLPSNQQPPTPVEPSQRSFHDPSSGSPFAIPIRAPGLLADRADVRCDLVGRDDLSTEGEVVPLVEA